MTTNFLKPIKLPCVLIVRSRVVKKAGRKIYVRGSIEDGNGESSVYMPFFIWQGSTTDRRLGNTMAESEAMLVDKTPRKTSKL